MVGRSSDATKRESSVQVAKVLVCAKCRRAGAYTDFGRIQRIVAEDRICQILIVICAGEAEVKIASIVGRTEGREPYPLLVPSDVDFHRCTLHQR